jgi:adenine-specific DNA methylase
LVEQDEFEDKVIMDPMAGGGIIPLESLTLGVKTIVANIIQ